MRLAVLFAVVTLLAVGAVGLFTYKRSQREVQDTVGTQLLNIARVAALLVDPSLHAEVQRDARPRLGRLPAAPAEARGHAERGALDDADPHAG